MLKCHCHVIYAMSTTNKYLDSIESSKAVSIVYTFVQTRYSNSYLFILIRNFDTIRGLVFGIEQFKKSIFSKCEKWMNFTENTTIYQMESDDVK
jgi:hypothetical protein